MQITHHLAQRLCAALGLGADRAAEIAAAFTAPPNLALGDVAFPCFQFAREQRKAPKAIAEDLAARIAPDDLIRQATAQGPYLNFFLDRRRAVQQVVGEVLRAPGDYGRGDGGQGGVVVLDFSAPNIAKPFHFGHLRSTNIGADLARILEFSGYRVVRKNYLGDWGTQFGFVIYAWQRWGDEAVLTARAIDYLVELYIRANQESEQDPAIRDQARELFRRLEQGDAEITALWRRFRELSLQGFHRTYARLGVGFDSYDGEAAINPRVDGVIERFRQAGVAVPSEGAIVVEVSDVLGREIAPCMLRKSDGASTYAARDCAEAIDRWERYGFAANLYVTSRQEDHFAQVFAALGKLAAAEGWPVRWPEACENVGFGYVRGMSTRKGEAVWLEHVLDEARDRAARVREEKAAANPRGFPALPTAELDLISESVGQAALLYFDVSSRRLSDVTFDWDSVLQFEGNTGPYLQYSHARMCGLFRRAGEAGVTLPAAAPLPAGDVPDEEWALVLMLRGFAGAVRRGCDNREPYEVAHYLHDLTSAFNTFYNRHTVIDASDGARTASRLALVAACQAVLSNGLRLLGIRALEYM
jgi:arginyl-tRNA synthetase